MNTPQNIDEVRLAVDAEDPVFKAAHLFAEANANTSDMKHPYFMWHGWALRASFIAGVLWCRGNSSTNEH